MSDLEITLPELQDFNVVHFNNTLRNIATGLLCIQSNDNIFTLKIGSEEVLHLRFDQDQKLSGVIVKDTDCDFQIAYVIANELGYTSDIAQCFRLCVDAVERRFHEEGTQLLTENGVCFSTPNLSPDDIILNVHQGCFVTAQGPVTGINYLGTSGLAPCLGVAFVTAVEGEECPRICLGHFDDTSDWEVSAQRFFFENGLLENNSALERASSDNSETTVSIISGFSDVDELYRLYRAFEKASLKPNIPLSFKPDINGDVSVDLVTDLRTGETFQSYAMGNNPLNWEQRTAHTDICAEQTRSIYYQYDIRRG